MRTAVLALGGNSLLLPGEKGTFKQQLKHASKTMYQLKDLFKNYRVVITHGNGPQVGNLMLQQDKGVRFSIDVLDAMTQGELGYIISISLRNSLNLDSVVVMTRIIVDKNDKRFSNPSKPVGPYYKKKIFSKMIKQKAGWRKVVASPLPRKIDELEDIQKLIKKNIVISCGGGGIPVIKKGKKLIGVEAVIDKDYASELLAKGLKADLLISLTDVPNVCLNFNTPKEKKIGKIKAKELMKHMSHFGIGSMRPKIESALKFLKYGKKVIITNGKSFSKAMKGKAGTIITR